VVEHTSPKARFGRRGFHKPNLGDFWLIAGHFGSLCNFCSLSDALTYDGMACDTNGLSPARQYIEVVEESQSFSSAHPVQMISISSNQNNVLFMIYQVTHQEQSKAVEIYWR
jgi:hypothetical protein